MFAYRILLNIAKSQELCINIQESVNKLVCPLQKARLTI